MLAAPMETLKVLVADPVSQSGVDALNQSGRLTAVVNTGLKEDELIALIPEFSALVVRSQTKVTARVLEAATKLKVVGRAGVGVDNVDVEAATRRGIVVMNTPGGNTISTAEHAFSLLVSTARRIPQATASVRAGKWERKKFEGVELYGKSLAILGMGRIGSELARRAIAFGMRVLAYDPYLSTSRARALQVELFEKLDEILPLADFISMHMPLTDETRHMINAERINLLKKDVRIVNCARGGLIDEAALADALNSGRIAGAALDVFEVEPPDPANPLLQIPNLILTPHLGASTAEAQESVGIEIAESIGALLLEGTIRNAVNVPNLDAKTLAAIGPYLDLAERLGRFLSQIAPPRADSIIVNYSGKMNQSDTIPVGRAVLKAFLARTAGSDVNEVNAPAVATARGLRLQETRISMPGDFTDLIEITAGAHGTDPVSVAGTFFGNSPRIVMINGRHVEAKPNGVLLVLENADQPGIVGRIGTTLGAHGVNIATMALSRTEQGGTALTVLNLDSEPSHAAQEALRAIDGILDVTVVSV